MSAEPRITVRSTPAVGTPTTVRSDVEQHAQLHRTCAALVGEPRSTAERACLMTAFEAMLTYAAREVTLYLALVSPLRPASLSLVPSLARHRSAADPLWARRQFTSRHHTGPQTSTAPGPGAVTGRSLRRPPHGLPSGRVADRLMSLRGSLFNPSYHGPRTALAPRGRMARALIEGRAPLNSRAHLRAIRPSAFILRSLLTFRESSPRRYPLSRPSLCIPSTRDAAPVRC